MSIGEVPAAARRQAGLTITQVSQRTCIRETIIWGVEEDDFTACGGDFLARGPIRAIARVAGVDGEPLVRQYDPGHGTPSPSTAADVPGPPAPSGSGSAASRAGALCSWSCSRPTWPMPVPKPAKANSRRRCCVHRHHGTIPGERDRLSVLRSSATRPLTVRSSPATRPAPRHGCTCRRPVRLIKGYVSSVAPLPGVGLRTGSSGLEIVLLLAGSTPAPGADAPFRAPGSCRARHPSRRDGQWPVRPGRGLVAWSFRFYVQAGNSGQA